MTAPACQQRVNIPVHSPIRMHNHTQSLQCQWQYRKYKEGRKEEEEEGDVAPVEAEREEKYIQFNSSYTTHVIYMLWALYKPHSAVLYAVER